MYRMSITAAAAFAFVALVFAASIAAAPTAQSALTEKEKIEALIRSVEIHRGGTFVCERGSYTGRRAAAYIRLKLQSDGPDIATAREFIEFVPKPMVHDAPYEVRFSDGSSMSIKEFLAERLQLIEAGVDVKDLPNAGPKPQQPAPPQPEKVEPRDVPSAEPESEEPLPSAMELRMRSMMNQIKKMLNAYDGWPITRYIRWNHLGMRTHLWDKQEMRDRLEYTNDEGKKYVVVLDLNARTGLAWEDDELITDPEKLAWTIGEALDMWVNDSFSMFMPYWLTEPGVKIDYVWIEPLPDDRDAHVYELTFEEGHRIAPLPKYRVHAAIDSGLIEQWECYENVDDIVPIITEPWTNWQVVGAILLSTERGAANGKLAQMTDVAVFESIPESAFTSPAAFELPAPLGQELRTYSRRADSITRANADAQQPTPSPLQMIQPNQVTPPQ